MKTAKNSAAAIIISALFVVIIAIWFGNYFYENEVRNSPKWNAGITGSILLIVASCAIVTSFFVSHEQSRNYLKTIDETLDIGEYIEMLMHSTSPYNKIVLYKVLHKMKDEFFLYEFIMAARTHKNSLPNKFVEEISKRASEISIGSLRNWTSEFSKNQEASSRVTLHRKIEVAVASVFDNVEGGTEQVREIEEILFKMFESITVDKRKNLLLSLAFENTSENVPKTVEKDMKLLWKKIQMRFL
jgi:hypothetical protein